MSYGRLLYVLKDNMLNMVKKEGAIWKTDHRLWKAFYQVEFLDGLRGRKPEEETQINLNYSTKEREK